MIDNEKFLIGLIAAIAAIAGGAFTFAASYLRGKYRMKELEYKKLRLSEEGRLSAAQSKLEDIYIPLLIDLEKIDISFDKYWKSKSEEDKIVFLSSLESLKNFYTELKQSGNIIYLVPEIHDEIGYIIRLVEESKTSSIVKAVVITRIEALGLRSVRESIYSFRTATCLYLLFKLIEQIRQISIFSSRYYFINTSLRVHSAPYKSEDFYSELKLSVMTIRTVSKNIALYKEIAGSIQNK